MAPASIRRARKNEGEQLARLWKAFLNEQERVDDRFRISDDAVERWMNDYPLWIEDDTRRIFVAEEGGEIVGFVRAQRYGPPPIYEDSSEVFVDELYVAPARRGEGKGSALVKAVRAWAEDIEADRLRLTYLSANQAAHTFWQKQQAQPFHTTTTIELEGKEKAASREGQQGRRIGF